ncbi:ATP F0F1 synthase synthase [Aeromonas jandaei]|uniref:ATP F0F1 synthase synthase n=1 Tax=Aeromonas jandaei TaxID=650 RepID=UPI00191DF9F7|nr:ATP F0F1 synthase synthase [Aeromonas jandaei]MBL0611310.1 ATP F0F1 synthase synthase [Aeromonas jandaei]
MNHLIAQIRTRNHEKVFKLFSDNNAVFELNTDTLVMVDYEVDHNLDEDAWFRVTQFSQQDYCLAFMRNDFIAAEFNDLRKADFTKIAYICSIQNGNLFFQKVLPSTYLSKKFLGFGDAIRLESSETRLCINQYPDAIYLRQTDTLVFRKLPTISSIFPGIDTLYKEATNEEVQQFLDEDFIELTDGFNLDKVSKPNRARIALAMDTLAEMEANEKIQMFTYINSYCEGTLDFNADDGTFEIKTDEQLKYLLYGIEERFYTTQLGQQKRLANSVQAMG